MKGWKPGGLVRCPVCKNEYETADWMPFTPKQLARAEAALRSHKSLLTAARRALTWMVEYERAGSEEVPPSLVRALKRAIAKAALLP